MPRMNGWDFLDEYEKLSSEQKGNIVIAMLTSSMNIDDEQRAKHNIDLKGFINKTLSKEKLNKIITSNFNEI